ncbi:MAG: hypothetical protein E6J65_29020 [Deltaproteobacteria bacterium]|nr:MAG: hypothetical protein E6J65_29020 [Deltaproteobacteria bacterium]
MQKTAAGVTTKYLIDDQTLAGYTQIAEERVSGAITNSYVYGLHRISMRGSAGVHYYGYDGHSGVRLLTDSGGNATDNWDYEAFGLEISRVGASDNRFTYRGEQIDTTLALQYLRARWMNPASGRFVTRDRYRTTDHPLAVYGYGGGDPVGRQNPTGLFDVSGLGTPAAIIAPNEQPPDLRSPFLKTNYNAIELNGITADDVFDRYLRTFDGVNYTPDPVN